VRRRDPATAGGCRSSCTPAVAHVRRGNAVEREVITPAVAHVRGNAVEREARAKAESGRDSRDVGSGGTRKE